MPFRGDLGFWASELGDQGLGNDKESKGEPSKNKVPFHHLKHIEAQYDFFQQLMHDKCSESSCCCCQNLRISITGKGNCFYSIRCFTRSKKHRKQMCGGWGGGWGVRALDLS